MHLPFILIVLGSFTLLVIIIGLVHASYVTNIRAFSERFFKKFKKRAICDKKVVPDNRPTHYVSRPNTTLIYYKDYFQLQPEKSYEKIRYVENPKDKYRFILRNIYLFLFAIFAFVLLISLVFLGVKFIFPLIGIPLSDSLKALINVTSNWNILTLLSSITIFFFICLILNKSKRNFYFTYRPIYINELNKAQEQLEFEETIIRVN